MTLAIYRYNPHIAAAVEAVWTTNGDAVPQRAFLAEIDRMSAATPAPSRWRLLRNQLLVPVLLLIVAVILGMLLERPAAARFPHDFHLWPCFYAIGAAAQLGGRRAAIAVWIGVILAEIGLEYDAVLALNWPVLSWLLLGFCGLGYAVLALSGASTFGSSGGRRAAIVRRRFRRGARAHAR